VAFSDRSLNITGDLYPWMLAFLEHRKFGSGKAWVSKISERNGNDTGECVEG
jgi:hypothetical protein